MTNIHTFRSPFNATLFPRYNFNFPGSIPYNFISKMWWISWITSSSSSSSIPGMISHIPSSSKYAAQIWQSAIFFKPSINRLWFRGALIAFQACFSAILLTKTPSLGYIRTISICIDVFFCVKDWKPFRTPACSSRRHRKWQGNTCSGLECTVEVEGGTEDLLESHRKSKYIQAGRARALVQCY